MVSAKAGKERADEGATGDQGTPAVGFAQVTSDPTTAPGWSRDERRFKVFTSYSRRDSPDCARRLVAALEARALAAKLDTRDLQLGEKWQAQLKDFIRQADAVVFIVSPKSIESTWCRWELAQVAVQSKRLVPVVHIPVTSDVVPARSAKSSCSCCGPARISQPTPNMTR